MAPALFTRLGALPRRPRAPSNPRHSAPPTPLVSTSSEPSCCLLRRLATAVGATSDVHGTRSSLGSSSETTSTPPSVPPHLAPIPRSPSTPLVPSPAADSCRLSPTVGAASDVHSTRSSTPALPRRPQTPSNPPTWLRLRAVHNRPRPKSARLVAIRTKLALLGITDRPAVSAILGLTTLSLPNPLPSPTPTPVPSGHLTHR